MIQGRIPDYLKDLNPEQLDAVFAEEKRLLILAGAGTGKTKVITSKIVYLVREKHIPPESVLAVTFTNKAANEMKERAMMIESACARATIRTFHSFGAWFMRRNTQAFGLRTGFTIYDENDSTELVHSIFPSLTKRECGDYAFLIGKAKDYYMTPDSPELGFISQNPEFRRIYAAYEARLRQTGNVDFGDLIFMPARLLEKDEAIRLRTRQRYRVILVDEYQDSNVAQFRLLQQLSDPDTMLCVVG
ncbi:MAG: UvrD-helicase domain-containing protein, partial [Rectinema sp.]|nr:UvrD-helicase domain-containing protein [Rectinema sp.]